MNKLLLAAAVVAGALGAAPAMAADAGPVRIAPLLPPTIQGYAGIGGALFNADGGFGISDDTLGVVAIGGAVNVPLGRGFNLQFESVAAQMRFENSGDSAWVAYSRGMLHLYARNPGHALGLYGGWENLIALPIWTLGAEAQAYMGVFTLYGQVALHHVDQGGIFTADWWSVRGAVQWFLSDNHLFQLDLRHQFDFMDTGESAFTIGGTIEHRHTGTPWSGFATLRSTMFSGSNGEDTISGLVGVRAHFGNGTLRQQYMTGASMNTLPLL